MTKKAREKRHLNFRMFFPLLNINICKNAISKFLTLQFYFPIVAKFLYSFVNQNLKFFSKFRSSLFREFR